MMDRLSLGGKRGIINIQDTKYKAICVGKEFSISLRDDGSIYSNSNVEYRRVLYSPKGFDFKAIEWGEMAMALTNDGSIIFWHPQIGQIIRYH